MSKKQYSIIFKVGIFILAPLLLILIPTTFFENGHSICIYKNILGFDCPSCGMTRAISCAFHLQIKKAFEYNKLVIIIFPLLSYLIIKHIVFLLKKF